MARGPDPVRVGLVGAGAVAQVAHLPAYRRLRTARLVAICDNEPTKRRALAERTGAEHAVGTLDELLAIDGIDAIDICLPNHLHKDAVIQCLESGKHVLCEKPLALTAQEVAEVLAVQERTGRTLVVGMNNRYRDDAILLKNFVEDGTLGEIRYARAGWFQQRDRIRPEEWRYRRESSGGGVFMDLGVQLLDLALWLCGYPEPERATAVFYHEIPEVGVEDSAVVTLVCANAVTVALETSWRFLGAPEPHLTLGLFGSEGSGFLSPVRIYQRVHGSLVDVKPQGQRRVGNLFMESYEREIAFFAEVVLGREEAPPLDEQLALARAVDAARRSAEEHREVSLAPSSVAGTGVP